MDRTRERDAERFELGYVAEDGHSKRPVMLHRAILGSLERFLGVYVEHVAGALHAGEKSVRITDVLEVWQIVERPAYRHLDQPRCAPKAHRSIRLDNVPNARAIRNVVVCHHATVVDKALLEQQFDRMFAQVP